MQVALRVIVGLLGVVGVLVLLQVWLDPARIAAGLGLVGEGWQGQSALRSEVATLAASAIADAPLRPSEAAVHPVDCGIDVLIHSMAFSREIKNRQLETSRSAYYEALGISAYSLTSLLRAAEPYMENRPGGASAVGLTYLGGSRVVPYYGGGMSTAKAALQIDTGQLAHNLGKKNIRVNLISAGPYASRAARGIGDIQQSIDYAAKRSPLPRGIEPEEVANATVFLCSPLASAITGHTLFVDCGYNVMGV